MRIWFCSHERTKAFSLHDKIYVGKIRTYIQNIFEETKLNNIVYHLSTSCTYIIIYNIKSLILVLYLFITFLLFKCLKH
jgi:hypothetical protein